MNTKKCIVISYEPSRIKVGTALSKQMEHVIEVHDFNKGVVDDGLLMKGSLPLNDIICSKDHLMMCDIRQGRGKPADMMDTLVFFESGEESIFDTGMLWLNGYRAMVGGSKFRWCLDLKTGNISSAAEHRNKFLYMHTFFVSVKESELDKQ